jgi:NAD(P)-dependent dehydrogenase (short-subunit alcohol dehydrogenase family)
MIHQLVKITALEGAYYRIRANCVAAGVTATYARCRKEVSTMGKTVEENEAFLENA